MQKDYGQKLKELSIFFPLLNEEKNLITLVKQALEVLPQVADKYEIVLINDGSTDGTQEIAVLLSRTYDNVRAVYQENRGYGGAVKRGFKEAKYEWIFFSDGDLQFDLNDLRKFIPHTVSNQLVIGYRKNRAEGTLRHFLALALRIWNKILLNFPISIKDIDCAFKLINRTIIQKVGELESDGAMLSTEFLLKAHRAGFKIKQVGVNHYKRQFGVATGNNMKVILRAIKDTFVLIYVLYIKSFIKFIKSRKTMNNDVALLHNTNS